VLITCASSNPACAPPFAGARPGAACTDAGDHSAGNRSSNRATHFWGRPAGRAGIRPCRSILPGADPWRSRGPRSGKAAAWGSANGCRGAHFWRASKRRRAGYRPPNWGFRAARSRCLGMPGLLLRVYSDLPFWSASQIS
jgi:hypothetical protein